jgi:DnaJ family protein C protein 17
MPNEDLLEHAKSTVDFYDLLGVAFETSESDIRRAYRKTALKYHPDKLGKDFDPEKFHLLQIANDVLSDPSAKAVYDNARNARLQKQRQHALFEGKRRQMKEELEAREKGGAGAAVTGAGGKRPREEDEMEKEVRRLAEEGKRRRREMEAKMRAQGGLSPTTTTPGTPRTSARTPEPAAPTRPEAPQTAAEEAAEEDEVARLERLIAEAAESKARRRAEKKARKSGVYVAADSPAPRAGAGGGGSKLETEDKDTPSATTTPIRRPDKLNGLKADAKPSASPKFSFTPKSGTPRAKNDEFSATMERLQAAEKRRLEEEIRRQDAAESAS